MRNLLEEFGEGAGADTEKIGEELKRIILTDRDMAVLNGKHHRELGEAALLPAREARAHVPAGGLEVVGAGGLGDLQAEAQVGIATATGEDTAKEGSLGGRHLAVAGGDPSQ